MEARKRKISGDIIAISCFITLHCVIHNWMLYDLILLLRIKTQDFPFNVLL